ncbi:threonine/serine exporter family protein [Treponema sp. J25]|uniref:threonine/serine exporter family protein n=1 Tax=Treponema sp. J25 TaxID=2094121 RepID=UPI001045745F|nr:threonine/serine exporter family protein [Treponema sp. J25]TCW62645.1 hypothetical protein C5O22_00910 [Treponema sp. J25]
MEGILWAGLSSGAFSMVFQVRGRHIPLSALGGSLGWAVYLLVYREAHLLVVANLLAALAIALYAEVIGALCKTPATTYLACALIPLVPGGGMYYTLSYSIMGNLEKSLATGFETLSAAGALAGGVAIGSVMARLLKAPRGG